MSSLYSRLLNIRPGEGRKVLLLVILFFLFITGTTWAETIIESSFYYLVGVSRLSQVFTLHALVAIISTAVYTAFVDQTSNQKLLVAVCAVASVAIGLGIALLGVNQVLGFTILYVLVRAVRTSFLIHWWNYASDFYDSRASKRIIPVINSASRFAIIFAGLTIPLLNHFLTPTAIILLWVATLLIIAVLSWVMNHVVVAPAADPYLSLQAAKSKKERLSYWRNIREGFQYVSSSNYLRWLALSTFLMVIIFGLLNYQGGLIFAQQFKTRAAITDFIGYLNGLTSLVMLPVQLFLFSRVVAKVGVGNANVIFPLGTFLISGSALIAPLSLTNGALAHFDRNTFRYSTQESSNNLLYNAVPARVKGRSRSFIDGLVLPVALLTSSALLELGKLMPANLFLPVLLGLPALAYLLCSLIIRNLYSRAMLSLLEQEDYSTLLPADGDISLSADPAAKNILLKKLAESQDDSVTLLIARIMTETAGTSVMPILEMKARESGPLLRAGILDVLATAEVQTISQNTLIRFFTSFLRDVDERVRQAAFNGLMQFSDKTSEKFLDQASQMLQDASYEIRSQALTCLLNSNNPVYVQPGEAALEQLLQQPEAPARICALAALGRTTDAHFIPIILDHLKENPDDAVRLQAIKALELRTAHDIPAETVDAINEAASKLISDPLDQIRLATLTILERNHSAAALELIANALSNPSQQVRKTAAEILVRAGEAALPALLKNLDAPPDATSNQSLLKAVLCRIDVSKFAGLVDGQILLELKAIYARNAQLNAIQGFTSGPGVTVLRNLFTEQNKSSLDAVFTLLSARYGEKPVKRITQSLAAQSSHTRANASEALESLLSPSLVKLIIPLLDSNLSTRELAVIGANTWPDTKPVTPASVITQLVADPQNDLIRGLAVYALGEIIPSLSIPEAAPVVESRRDRRLNLFDKLMDDMPHSGSTTPVQARGNPAAPAASQAGLKMISQPEARYLISVAQTDSSRDVRSAALAAARLAAKRTDKPLEGKPMTASLSVIERIIFLKQVPLFQSMTIDQLKVLASICEDEYVPQGTVIFKEGDPGGVVYVVVNGRIGIEREGNRQGSIVRLATLESRASFGEMNMFDNSPRSADAVAVEDSLLLKLRGEPFGVLIRQQPDMSLELIKVLSSRIREANNQIAHLTRSTPRQLQKLYDKLEDDTL